MENLTFTDNFLTKFAIVLSKTKDVLLADLKKQFPEDNITDITRSIDKLFYQLGYDLSGILPEEIKNVTQEAIDASEDLTQIIKKIANIAKSDAAFLDILKDIDKDESGNKDDLIQHGQSLLKNITEMIKAFKELERLNIGTVQEQWEKFTQENNFNQDFPKRLFDHIISTFLKNASEVFSEDIRKLKEALVREIKGIDGELREKMDVLIDRIEQIFGEIQREGELKLKTVSKNFREIIKIINGFLKNEFKDAQNETKEILKKIKNFIQVEAYFQRVYTILDFMQVIGKERVHLFSVNATSEQISFSTEIYVIHWNRFEEMVKNPIQYYKSKYPVNNVNDAQDLVAKLIKVAQAFGLDIPDYASLKGMLIEMLQKIEELAKKYIEENIAPKIKEKINEIKETIRAILLILERIALEAKRKIKTSVDTIFTSISTELSRVYTEIHQVHLLVGENYPRATGNLSNYFKDITFQNKLTNSEIEASLKRLLVPALQSKAIQYKEFNSITEEDWNKLIEEISHGYKAVYSEIKEQLGYLITPANWNTNFEALKNKIHNEFSEHFENVPSSWEQLSHTLINNPKGLLPNELLSNFDLREYFAIIARHIQETFAIFNPESYYLKFREVSITSFQKLTQKTDATAEHFKAIVTIDVSLSNRFAAFLNEVLIECWKEIRKELLDNFLRPFMQSVEAVVKNKMADFIEQLWTSDLLKDIKEIINNIPEAVSKEAKEFVREVFPVVIDASKNGINNWQDGVKLAFKIGKPLYELIDAIIDSTTENSTEKAENIRNDFSKVTGIPSSSNIHFSDEPSGKSTQGGESKHVKKINFNLPSYALDKDNKFLSVTLYETETEDKKSKFSFSLCAFVGVQGEGDDKKTGVYFIPVLQGNYDHKFDLGKIHELNIKLSGELNNSTDEEIKKRKEELQKGAIGLFLAKKKAEVLSNTDKIKTDAILEFTRKKDQAALSIVASKYLDLSIGNYPQAIALKLENNTFSVAYRGEIKDAKAVLKITQINEFFAALVKNDIEAKFDLAVLYDTIKGFSFDGSASLKIEIVRNKKIADVFTIKKLDIETAPSDTKDSSVKASFNTSFILDLKQVKFIVSDLGIGIHINYRKEDGSLGDFDFTPSFTFPTGMGVSIDATAIKGTGAISYDREKEEFFGVLDLAILDKIEIKALALLTMKMPDGGKGFSFIGIISVYFTPGIPLGMGFSLTGMGGAVGLNRRISREQMEQGVRDGAIAAVFFVENVEEHLDTMLTQMGSYFPVHRNQFFFGALAKITFAEIIDVDLGLLIQAPKPPYVFFVGALTVALPTKEKALIQINAYFLGTIDFAQGMSFDASLVNSKIMLIEMFGDIAFRLNWGKNKSFILSAGGFHPGYTPDAALRLHNMKRLTMKMDYKVLRLQFTHYFALTSNTVQFGSKIDLKIEWAGFKVLGYFEFDCLFQFKPFYFMFDVSTGVEVSWKKIKLLAVNLNFSLSGPAPWNAKGEASFKILFFSKTVRFNYTWGKEEKDNQISYTSIYQLISNEYHKPENWKILPTEVQDAQVRLKPNANAQEKELLMQPFCGLSFEQATVPLNENLQKFGEGIQPADYSNIGISKVEIGNKTFYNLESTQYDFAPALFFNLNDKEKLTAPSYEKMNSGIQIKDALNERAASTVEHAEVGYRVEQDEISFTNDGFSLKEDGVKKQLGMKSVPTPSDLSEANLKVTEKSVINAFVSISHRSKHGFNRHVNYKQKQKKERNGSKMEPLIQEPKGAYKFVLKDRKLSVEELKIFNSLNQTSNYTQMLKIKTELDRKYPKLKGKYIVVKL